MPISEKFVQIGHLLLLANSSCPPVSAFRSRFSGFAVAPLWRCLASLSPPNPTVRKIGILPRRNPCLKIKKSLSPAVTALQLSISGRKRKTGTSMNFSYKYQMSKGVIGMKLPRREFKPGDDCEGGLSRRGRSSASAACERLVGLHCLTIAAPPVSPDNGAPARWPARCPPTKPPPPPPPSSFSSFLTTFPYQCTMCTFSHDFVDWENKGRPPKPLSQFFYWTQVYLGSDLWVQVSLSDSLTDVWFT